MRKQVLRILSFVLLAALMIGCFAGCGKDEEQPVETTVDDYTPDSTLRILMVGNSFCYYYVEELYELLMENPPEGIDAVEIYNLYYSGCKIDQHYDWWVGNKANYDLYKVDTQGRQKMTTYDKWTLEQALVQADWDYISLQGSMSGGSYLKSETLDALCVGIAQNAAPLLARFHELFPHAQLLWHRTWFSEVGRVTSNGYTYKEEDEAVYDEGMQKVCDYMCGEFLQDKPYDMKMVNSGVAWTKARELNQTLDLLPYGGLCARLGKNSFGDQRVNAGDGYHDGDIGGAQLLNAYVWYMTITGNTDLTASTYIPVYKQGVEEYPLSEELVAMLKDAAMRTFQEN